MEPTSPQRIGSACVLVADDDAGMRGWLREALETAGYDVLEAANGKRAVELLKRERVDLVITDLAMPEQEGMETIRLLKGEYPELKIIAISGAFGGTFLEIAKLLGAGAALLKPIQLDNLLNTVKQLLRK
jgi:CheY-like chemotaxis protein